MAISRANIGKEIKMSWNKKVTKYKKGKQIHKKRKRKGLLDPKDNFDKLADEIWATIINTREQGQNEYARTEEDVLANFKRISNWKNETQESVLMTYMLKHIDGMLSYINGFTSHRENVRGRITDVIVYCMLFWAMVDENES